MRDGEKEIMGGEIGLFVFVEVRAWSFDRKEFDLDAELEDNGVVEEEQRGAGERVKVDTLVGDSAEERVTDDDVVSSEGDFTIVLEGEDLTED